jgi:hypothetical protein
MAAGDGFFNSDNIPFHTFATVKDCMAAMNIMTFLHLSYSLDLVSTDYFLFPGVNSELVGISMA